MMLVAAIFAAFATLIRQMMPIIDSLFTHYIA